MSDKKGGFFDSLAGATRDNPLAAVLIGGGALWLLAGDDKLKNAAQSLAANISTTSEGIRAAASSVRQAAAPPTAPDMGGEEGVGHAFGSAVSATTDAASQTASKVAEKFDEGVAFARENAAALLPNKDTLTNAQSSLNKLLERQPLVLGVVGLAIGAAIAGAFQISDIENEYVGSSSDDLKTDLERRASAVSDALQRASGKLAAEVGDNGVEAVDRLKQAGFAAVDAAKAKLHSRADDPTYTFNDSAKPGD